MARRCKRFYTSAMCKSQLIMPCRWASTLQKASPSAASGGQVQAMIPFTWKALSLWHTRLAELRRRLLVTLLSVLFYYYPSLLTTILSLLACYRIDPSTPASGELYSEYARVSFQSHVCILLCVKSCVQSYICIPMCAL